MKKITSLIFMLLFIANMLLVTSCESTPKADTPGQGDGGNTDGTQEREEENLPDSPTVVLKEDLTNTVFYGDYLIDDRTPVSELKNEYSLSDLKEFFKDKHNEQVGSLGELTPSLSLSDVNARFPIEIIRSNGYVVYKVKEGGYFYVFWIGTLDNKGERKEHSVWFSAYLKEDLPLSKFSSLAVKSSTAQNVKAIDSEVYIDFSSSLGTYSYSYLNDATLLEIKYKNIASPLTYDALLITEIRVVARGGLSGGLYGIILSKDLPE